MGVKFQVGNNYSLISGPGVVIHRVGNPSPSKVCTIKKKESYILSDCVIFMKTATVTDSIKLQQYILSNWLLFENLYKGTGAKYTTLKRLRDFFDL